ncbi:hypothetical protein GTO91_06750 [Heliobacterium undosum]|uniref:DUF4412 domain-containing protein n=1 Tax=Heliomicrobium undosum TaxID=121734 RepID=A0A845KZB9_9FIRM|nr:DUF6612 family protein [Heliomicrobium undosum]MZP29402.1 hypothetical protein [Heliomicrobium undosum]
MKRWFLNGILGLSLLLTPAAAMADDGASALSPAMEVFKKTTEVTAGLSSYLITGDLQATVNVPEMPAPLSAKMKLRGAVATEPSRVSMKMTMEMPKMAGQPVIPDAPGSIDFRFYLDGKDMYMQMPFPDNPASDQWVKQEMDLPAEFQELLAQSQNPAKSLEMIDKMGLMPTDMEEQWVDGRRYYVVTLQLDNSKMKAYMQEAMTLSKPKEGVDAAELNEAMKNIELDFRYIYYINADTYVTDRTDFKGVERITAEGKTVSIDLEGTILTHDVNIPIRFPDVSNAVDMKELDKQAGKTAKGAKTSK